MIKVAVQGLGFVGSAVAIALSSVKKDGATHFQVFGVEKDDPEGKKMVRLLNAGQSCFSNADENFIRYLNQGLHSSRNLKFGTDKNIYSEVSVVICDVGMDVKLTGTYDTQEVEVMDQPFMSALKDIFSKIRPETLVIIETTLPPGMVEKRVIEFAQEILNSLKKKGIRIVKICLHVDYGTFVSIRGKIEDHKMHSEWFEIDQNAADLINNCIGRLICVGTTTLRSLESANYDCAGKIMPTTKKTDIFIYPGYKFKSKTDLLLSNFHLPKSTLLLLVSAFSVREIILNAYEIAKEKKYRFFSLGDCMLISKQKK